MYINNPYYSKVSIVIKKTSFTNNNGHILILTTLIFILVEQILL